MKDEYQGPRFLQIRPEAQIGEHVGYGYLLFLRNFATPEDAIEVAAEEGGKIAPAGPLNDPNRLWAVVVPGYPNFGSREQQAQASADVWDRALAWPLMVANDRYRDDGEAEDDEWQHAMDDDEQPADAEQWDFETTFPQPTPAALRALICDQHYPDPDDAEAVYEHFQMAALECCQRLDAADACERNAAEIRRTGRYPGKRRSLKQPDGEAQRVDREARDIREQADGIIDEIQRIYGDAATAGFRAHCDRLRQQDAAEDDADERFTLDRVSMQTWTPPPPAAAQLSLF